MIVFLRTVCRSRTRNLAEETRRAEILVVAMGKAKFITPVPGGVGPMTIAMLMKNLVTAAMLQTKPKSSTAGG